MDTTTGTNLSNFWIPETVADTGPSTSVVTTPGHSYNSWVHTRKSDGSYSTEIYRSFTCAVPTYSCSTPAPTNATICSGDDTGLSSNTTSIVVGSCTAPTKCEYTCNAGYQATGNTCVPIVVPPVITCHPEVTYAGHLYNPAPFAGVGQLVTWVANTLGTWSGATDGGSSSGQNYLIRYSTVGNKKVYLTVGATTVQCTTDVDGLPILNNPIFVPN
jgi:hypothetical protein